MLQKSLYNLEIFHYTGVFSPSGKGNFSKITSLLEHRLIKICLNFRLIEPPNQGNFQYILDFIEQNKLTLKHIHLNCSRINDVCLQSISAIKDLDLQSVHLKSCLKYSHLGLKYLLKFQKNIIELDISECIGLTDDTVSIICENLPRIKTLNMNRCSAITDVSL